MSDNFLQVAPSELTFKFELKKNIPVALTLTNVTDERVAFKVKTTSPKKYCVRPSSGIIEPGSTKEVQVIMQPQREAPAAFGDCKDKFQVQCAKVDGAAKEVTAEMFEASREVRQTKLRVALVAPAKPPSPVPEGSESEPTPRQPPRAGADYALAQARAGQRIADKFEQPPAAARALAAAQAPPPPAGYGLLSLLLVALLAFLVGHLAASGGLPALGAHLEALQGGLAELKDQLLPKVLKLVNK